MKQVRAFRRGLRQFGRLGWIVVSAWLDYFFRVRGRRKSPGRLARAQWLQRWSARALADLDIPVERHGTPPATGVLVCNHLSYIDILVLASAQPVIFVAKHEIRYWPVFGRLARCAGTLFVRRDRKSDVAKFDDAFAAVVGEGVVLGLFPEGTSSNGRQVLPFYSSLFEPAVAHHWPVSAARIGYTLAGGSAETDVCYWGDMTFFPHLVRLLCREGIRAKVVYGSAALPAGNRKQLALQLHRQVTDLGQSIATPAAVGPDPERAAPAFAPPANLMKL